MQKPDQQQTEVEHEDERCTLCGVRDSLDRTNTCRCCQKQRCDDDE